MILNPLPQLLCDRNHPAIPDAAPKVVSLPIHQPGSAPVTRGADEPPRRLRRTRRAFLNAVPLDAITEPQCVEAILSELDAGRGGFVVTHNLDHMRRLDCDAGFAAVCAEADIRVSDGMPLVWLSRLLPVRVPVRVAGSSLIHTLTAAAAGRDRSVYLLGGDEGTAESAAEALRRVNPALRIAGTLCPSFGFENDRRQMDQIIQRLRDAAPDIVYVAVGSPKQEFLIARLRKHLPRAWWLGVGISFSYACGRVRRPPTWIQTIGCEWLYRMIQEPRRLIRRYLFEGIPFGLRLCSRCIADLRNGRPVIYD